jgi:hypothetical protein
MANVVRREKDRRIFMAGRRARGVAGVDSLPGGGLGLAGRAALFSLPFRWPREEDAWLDRGRRMFCH